MALTTRWMWRRCEPDNAQGVRVSLPARFLDRLRTELGGDQASAIRATMCADKDVAYWLNPLREGKAPEWGLPVPGLVDVFACSGEHRPRLTRHPAASSGRIYLLNPSSTLAVAALDPQPGEQVLDVAAAPGGKTVLTAARMRNTGAILALDASKPRYLRLRANLDRCGVSNARCRLADGRRLAPQKPLPGHRLLPRPELLAGSFDRILLDAPCSSEARFRADDAATTRYWSPGKVKECAQKQRGLIRAAFRCLRPGGTLVYCTCAFSRRENEAVIAYLLRREPQAAVRPLEFADVPVVPGSISGTLRILPNRLFDGFFLARLTRFDSHGTSLHQSQVEAARRSLRVL